jgi:glycosyltransferase involved in cell wall biosynthesis
MTGAPEISVVIPTRDRWPLLSTRALPAALAQVGVDHEVIVVDDGSNDDTSTHLSALSDPRLRVVGRGGAKGLSRARNAGIAAARGEWVAFLDDDDVWAPEKLRMQLDVGRASGAELVYAAAIAVDEGGTVLHELYLPEPDRLRMQLDEACVIPAGCSNVIARTERVRTVGGFDEELANLADWDLWIRLLGSGRAAVCREVLVAYMLHARNLHVVSDPERELEYLIRKHANAPEPRRVVPDRVGYSRWVASQRLRAGRPRQAAWVYLRGAVAHRAPGNVARAADALLGKRLSVMFRRRAGTEGERRPAPPWLRDFAP